MSLSGLRMRLGGRLGMQIRPGGEFLRMIGSAVLSQALLSAGNLLVGLILIRRTVPEQYGYFVLVTTTLLLLSALQGAYIQPSLVLCLAAKNLEERRDFVGGLVREQIRRLLALAGLTAGILVVLRLLGLVSDAIVVLGFAGIAAALAALCREFFRMVLVAYRMPTAVLKVDIFYVALLGGGVFASTLTPMPALVATLTLAMAAATSGWLLSRRVRGHEGWNAHGAPGVLAKIAHIGGWAVAGSAIHWAFAQGYIYVVAGTLDLTAVATLSATRLVMMPVNLMSSGVGSMTFPTVSRWLQHHSVKTVFFRLLLLASGIAGLGLIYLGIMWLLRDWIFTYVIKGHFDHRDTLLVFWSCICLLMAMRDQMFLPAARGKFQAMAWLTFVTAIVSLLTSFLCMRAFGVVGAVAGVLAGELFNLTGYLILCLLEVRRAATEVSPVRAAA